MKLQADSVSEYTKELRELAIVRENDEKIEKEIADKFAAADDAAPAYFKCAIGLRIMRDPVVTETGHSYERKTIETWIREEKTDPMSRAAIEVEDLRPNKCLQEAIANFVDNYKGL